jgi:hypothetical protein
MKDAIGETSGAIWKALQNEDKIALSAVPKLVGRKESLAYQAVGWLAREGKIDYETIGRKTYIALAAAEKQRS